MTTIKVKDAYGYEFNAVIRTPEHMTDREAAQSIGISTQKFNKVTRNSANNVSPMAVAGSEKNKVPTYVYTPEQVERVKAILGI
jgi:hypothetical protein